MSALKALMQKLLGFLLGGYSPYYIYKIESGQMADVAKAQTDCIVRPVEADDLTGAASLLQQQADYLGEGARAFGCFQDGVLAGVCFYWFGERYKTRGFWSLRSGEAKLVQIVVAPDARGRGVAPALIRASARAMVAEGFSSLYARIWHSNTPSLRAFEKSGWVRIAFVLECNPFRSIKPLRFQRRLTPGQ